MTTREKIIVGLMCLTILYGAFELLGNRGGNKISKTVQNVNPEKELKEFTASVTQKLVDEKVSAEYRYLITQAANDWNKDPFINSTTPLKKQLTVPKVPQKKSGQNQAHDYVYTGYLKIGSIKLAIINGTEYAEGESLNTKGLFIKSISAHEVVIAKVNGLGTIILPISDTGPANEKQ